MNTTLTDIVLVEILDRLNLADIPESKKDEYRKKLDPIIEHRIGAVLITSMSPEQRSMFEVNDKTNTFTQDMLEILLTDPAIEDKVGEELVKIIDEYSEILS